MNRSRTMELDLFIQILPSFPQLTKLALMGVKELRRDHLKTIAKCTNLSILNLSRCSQLYQDQKYIEFEQEMVYLISQCNKLKEFRVSSLK